MGTCRAPLESSRRGGRFEYRRAHTRAVGMPSAMADAGYLYMYSYGPLVLLLKRPTSTIASRALAATVLGNDFIGP